MIILQIDSRALLEDFGQALTRDECCEALVGERAFIENDIVVSDAPERGPGNFDIILGKGLDKKRPLDLTITFGLKHVDKTEEEA